MLQKPGIKSGPGTIETMTLLMTINPGTFIQEDVVCKIIFTKRGKVMKVATIFFAENVNL